jgi:hypothetical protein
VANQWQNSLNGPDWTDVLVFMKAIENLHSVSVVISIVPTVYDGPSGMLTISARQLGKDASVLGSYVAALSGEWPCREHANMTDCIFAGLYQIDHQLSVKVWKQNILPGTGE